MFIFAFTRRSSFMATIFLVDLIFAMLILPIVLGNSPDNQMASGMAEEGGTAVTMTTMEGSESNNVTTFNVLHMDDEQVTISPGVNETGKVGKSWGRADVTCHYEQSTMENINTILFLVLQSVAILLMALLFVVIVMQIRSAHCYFPGNAQQQTGIDNVAIEHHNITPAGGQIFIASSPAANV